MPSAIKGRYRQPLTARTTLSSSNGSARCISDTLSTSPPRVTQIFALTT